MAIFHFGSLLLLFLRLLVTTFILIPRLRYEYQIIGDLKTQGRKKIFAQAFCFINALFLGGGCFFVCLFVCLNQKQVKPVGAGLGMPRCASKGWFLQAETRFRPTFLLNRSALKTSRQNLKTGSSKVKFHLLGIGTWNLSIT